MYFWPQGSSDYEYLVWLFQKNYISSDVMNAIKIIKSSVKDYENFLREEETDFIGTILMEALNHYNMKKEH